MKNLLKLAAIVLAAFIVSCNKSDDGGGVSSAQMQVRMADAPGDFDQVLIDVEDVLINYSSDTSSGWVSIGNVRKGQYDLLKLTAGLDTLLVSGDVVPARVNQIRLVLGPDNFVMVDSVLEPLQTPSAQQSGLKININADLAPGQVYRVLLDFDVSKSIVETGNGKYILKPVIRAVVETAGGAIEGAVNPGTFISEVMAIQGTDTVTTLTDDDGDFLIRGLSAGTYTVLVRPLPGMGFSDKSVTGVVVTTGVTTNMGTIDL